MESGFKKLGYIVILALLAAGCSKKGSNPTGPGGSSSYPKLILPDVLAPQSSSSTADTSQGYMEVNNDNSLLDSVTYSLSTHLTGTPTDSAGTWKWLVNDAADTVTSTLTATANSGEYYWTLVIASPELSIKFLAGLVAPDGKSGDLNFLYNPVSNVPAATYNWSTTSGGQLDGTIYVSNFLGIVGQKYVFTNNPDKSGTLNEWRTLSGGSVVQTWNIIWNANQSGHYTEWDTTGAVVDSGNWN